MKKVIATVFISLALGLVPLMAQEKKEMPMKEDMPMKGERGVIDLIAVLDLQRLGVKPVREVEPGRSRRNLAHAV